MNEELNSASSGSSADLTAADTLSSPLIPDAKNAPEGPEPLFTHKIRPSLEEIIGAFLILIAGYLYVSSLWYIGAEVVQDRYLIGFTLLTICITLLLARKKRPAKESFFWLFCLLACALSLRLNFGHHVWKHAQLILFIHLFLIWWILSRTGKMLEKRTGHFAPFDLLNGALLIPLGHYFLRIRVLSAFLKDLENRRKHLRASSVFLMLFAALAAFLLLKRSLALLSAADVSFSSFVERVSDALSLRFTDKSLTVLIRMLLAFPAAAWLFGLIAGAVRTEEEKLESRKAYILRALYALRRVTRFFWIFVLSVFSVFYIVFFAMQSLYLFGAFSGTIPEGLNASAYARQGFFELCRVISVNFAVLWLVTRTSERTVRESRLLLIACCVFLSECLLFCLIAFSKLFLYIRIFGFTPLRFESAWLILVLSAACVLWMIHLITEKKTFRFFALFSSVTLSLLALY